MRHQRRRRIDVVWLLLAAAAVGVVAIIGAAVGDAERIDGYWASARLEGGGAADVVEVIDYDFGVQSRHGIFRDVPGLELSASVRASSPTAPDQFVLEPLGGETRIRIGDPNRTIWGRHRYVIEYPIGIDFADNTVSWNAVGTQWEVGIRDVEIHLLTDRELTDVQCSKGTFGSWGGCTAQVVEPGHLRVDIDKLDANEAVTISGRQAASSLPAAPTVGPPQGDVSDPGVGLQTAALFAAPIALLGALLASRLVRRAGREWVWAGGSADAAFGPASDDSTLVRRVDHDELADLATTEFEPPRDLKPWQGGVLLSERARPEHRVAWLIERAIDGEVTIEGEGKNMTLRQSPERPPGVNPLSSMFSGRAEVQLGKYDPQFKAAWDRLGAEHDNWHKTCGLWDTEADQRRTRTLVWGVLGTLASLAAVALGAGLANRFGRPWLALVIGAAFVAGACLAAVIRSWELRIRTPEGSGLWLRVESFRRFLHDSDARHAEQAAGMGYLLEYTAWAVAVGEIDRWTKAVEASSVAQSADVGGFYMVHAASNLSRATSTASTAPSSSGGGGGGSSGGGGGGGGGGSW